MSFQYYSNLVSKGTRNFASGVFVTGMLLIGFGFLIWILRELFAMLFAVLFCIAGIGCIVTGVKMFWSVSKFEKMNSDGQGAYRENVHVRVEDNGVDVQVHGEANFD
ncbi:MAG: hypothetical protein FVQ80_01140 [Planctomycetes bacterium]|nr:hypothetical protein [Planctomycetota bacterium]